MVTCYTPDRRNTVHSITGAKVSGILTPRLRLLPYHRIKEFGRTQDQFIRKSHMPGQGFQGAGIQWTDSEDEFTGFEYFLIKIPYESFPATVEADRTRWVCKGRHSNCGESLESIGQGLGP